MINKKILIGFGSLIGLIGNVSAAYNYYGGYGIGSSFIDMIVSSEEIRFVLFFGLFFAAVYLAIGRAFPTNKGPAIVLSVVISLLITFTLVERGFMYGYLGEEIGNWFLIIALLMGMIFLIRGAYKSMGRGGGIITLLIVWALFAFFFKPFFFDALSGSYGGFLLDFYQGFFGREYDFISSVFSWGFGAVVFICILIAIFGKKKGESGIHIHH